MVIHQCRLLNGGMESLVGHFKYDFIFIKEISRSDTIVEYMAKAPTIHDMYDYIKKKYDEHLQTEYCPKSTTPPSKINKCCNGTSLNMSEENITDGHCKGELL